MLGMRLLSGLFARERESNMEVEKMVEAVKVELISEPVISLAKSIAETDDWEMTYESEGSIYHRVTVLRHKIKALELRFTKWHSYKSSLGPITVSAEWMNGAEKEHVVAAYETLLQRHRDEAERERQRQLAAEREKFMVLVTSEGESK